MAGSKKQPPPESKQSWGLLSEADKTVIPAKDRREIERLMRGFLRGKR